MGLHGNDEEDQDHKAAAKFVAGYHKILSERAEDPRILRELWDHVLVPKDKRGQIRVAPETDELLARLGLAIAGLDMIASANLPGENEPVVSREFSFKAAAMAAVTLTRILSLNSGDVCNLMERRYGARGEPHPIEPS